MEKLSNVYFHQKMKFFIDKISHHPRAFTHTHLSHIFFEPMKKKSVLITLTVIFYNATCNNHSSTKKVLFIEHQKKVRVPFFDKWWLSSLSEWGNCIKATWLGKMTHSCKTCKICDSSNCSISGTVIREGDTQSSQVKSLFKKLNAISCIPICFTLIDLL